MARGRRFRRGPASRRGLVGGYNRSSPLLRWSVSSLRWAARSLRWSSQSLRWSSQSLRWSSQSLRWSSRSLPLVVAVAALVIAVADGGHHGCCAGQRGRGAGQRGRRAGQRGRCAAPLFEGDRTPANRVGDDTGSRAVFTGPPRHALTRGAASTRIGLLRLRAPSKGKTFRSSFTDPCPDQQQHDKRGWRGSRSWGPRRLLRNERHFSNPGAAS
jgi:hypothetical protein